ncbi:hypothetical protein [Mycobacteroides abscessus]|uniref:hypothetical protein n=1 Tax=Desemzia sp. FAM 23989 TaxID=3259523 RepID=UPI0009D5D694|nr:Uncharacterised protein [Mycobacteroides abscessus subsp. abscessus]
MAMTPFEKAVVKELQGIKKELHEMNKKKPEQGQVDGTGIHIDSGALSNAISNRISNNLR